VRGLQPAQGRLARLTASAVASVSMRRDEPARAP
jgi:hypothetical protein